MTTPHRPRLLALLRALAVLLALATVAGPVAHADDDPVDGASNRPRTQLWLGSYNTIRLNKKWYWEAQHHFRTSEYDGVPFVGRMGQIYNRHALTHRFSPSFFLTAGGVLRLNFASDPQDPELRPVVLEPRFWHQYLFPIEAKVGERSVLIQHRLRIEHRWSRPNDSGASWIFRNRWRYRFTLKLPLFGKDIDKRSLYAIPINIETILQSGAPVGGAILEDLRIYPSIGYKFNYRVAVTGGLMYTTGQVLGEPTRFTQRLVPRLNLFWTPDLRHRATRMPEPRLYE